MTLSSRSLRRASALTLAALTLVACSDSTAPLDVSPEQLEVIGQAMATEIESGITQLSAQDAMNGLEIPQFSVQRRAPGGISGLSLSLQGVRSPSFQAVGSECGVFSQNPPTDSDADQVPDNLTITFSLPACRFVEENGTFDLTGVIRVTDPAPGTAAMAFNMSMDNVRFTFVADELSGYVRRDGLTAVSVSQTGLSQTVSGLESAELNGYPSLGVDVDWSATFAAAQGSTITHGQPLPDGVYNLNGSMEYRQGSRSAHFTVSTVEALQYSAECAAAVAEGLAWSPFVAGTVRVAVRNDANMGFAQITYTDCNEATVVYVAR
ncbi:MAG TPA: hypothetical protein VJ650_06635 [Gemmatimonadaceae bacterium]|nr:hypothetical protein [Gemmatimonadaceae bacterium]